MPLLAAFPALKRWAKHHCASGAVKIGPFSWIRIHPKPGDSFAIVGLIWENKRFIINQLSS
jgi:hypothetical protein